MRLPFFVERILARLLHRHSWYNIGVNRTVSQRDIFRQACRVTGCGKRRLIYDDGARVSLRLGLAIERQWRGGPSPFRPIVDGGNGRRIPRPADPVETRQAPAVEFKPGTTDGKGAPRTGRSAAIRRLEGAVSRLHSVARKLPDTHDGE